MTRPFVATTVLQLVGERRVVLDAPVERYLPGVVRGDGRVITVRQLLQQTSGIPDYLAYLSTRDVRKEPLAHHDTRDLMTPALANPPARGPEPRSGRCGYGDAKAAHSMIVPQISHSGDTGNVAETRETGLTWVELRGFEPLTPSMRTRCATGLRYSPKDSVRLANFGVCSRTRLFADGAAVVGILVEDLVGGDELDHLGGLSGLLGETGGFTSSGAG